MSSDIADWHDYEPEDSNPEAPLTGHEAPVMFNDILMTLNVSIDLLGRLADDLDTVTTIIQAASRSLELKLNETGLGEHS